MHLLEAHLILSTGKGSGGLALAPEGRQPEQLGPDRAGPPAAARVSLSSVLAAQAPSLTAEALLASRTAGRGPVDREIDREPDRPTAPPEPAQRSSPGWSMRSANSGGEGPQETKIPESVPESRSTSPTSKPRPATSSVNAGLTHNNHENIDISGSRGSNVRLTAGSGCRKEIEKGKEPSPEQAFDVATAASPGVVTPGLAVVKPAVVNTGGPRMVMT